MLHRLASLFLIFLTAGFFYLVHGQKNSQPPFVDTVWSLNSSLNSIANNEYLLLMEQGAEQELGQVLDRFGLEIMQPLGEWVHVATKEASLSQQMIDLNSPQGQKNQHLLAALEADPAVHSAALNYIQSNDGAFSACNPELVNETTESDDALIAPKDPMYRFQWHLSPNGANISSAWGITRGDPRTVIAVVDRNFMLQDPDLLSDHCPSRHYYYENVADYMPQKRAGIVNDAKPHGTNVLNILAPCTNNALGLAGIDWYAQIFAIDSLGDASLSARMFGVLWASGLDVCTKSLASCPKKSAFQRNLHPANIINTSFGFAGAYLKDPPYGTVLDIIGHINRQGRIIIASAGNEGGLADRRLPGSAGGVISVGASNQKQQSASFSNFGRTVDVVAPGENLFSTFNNAPIALNGTSFSAPIVAGIAGLMLAANPDLSWKHIEYILKTTAKPMSCQDYCPLTMKKTSLTQCQKLCCQGEQSICAAGIVDANKAVAMAKAGIPKVALIDVDDYYLPLSQVNQLRTILSVKNWGAERALVRFKTTDPYLTISPANFLMAAASPDGIPSYQNIMVSYAQLPDRELVLGLVLEAASFNHPELFNDRIEAIVEIVPDQVAAKRMLRELVY